MSRSRVISIGILAWNEECSIRATLSSVFSQAALSVNDGTSFDIVCVANGCTDRTASVARDCIAEHASRLSGIHRARVVEIPIPSKENAWNAFVHELSSREAKYLVFMDGDVRLAHPEVLGNLIRTLESDDHIWIAGGMPVKHLAGKWSCNPLHWISLAASSVRRQSPDEFGGCLYAARAEVMRRFALPDVLVGEDCFVSAMIKTEFFTTDQPTNRIRRAPDSQVEFEAYTTPATVYKNLKRRAVELAIDSMLYDELWARSVKGGPDAGELIMHWHASDPEWAQKVIRQRIQERGRWVLPRGLLTKWFARVSRLRFPQNLFMLPVALCGTLANIVPCMRANHIIKRGGMKNLWFVTETQIDER